MVGMTWKRAPAGLQAALSKPFLISLYVSLGGFLYGFDSGIMTPTLVQKHFVSYFNHPSSDVTGAVVSVYQGGGFFGSLIAGSIGNKIGRKKTMLVGGITGIIGSILMSAAAHIAMLMIGRVLVGACVAIITSASPVYASEISRKHERARVSSVTQLMVALGFFTANWTGYGFKSVDSDGQWRAPFAIQAIPAIVLASGVMFLPESPRWLCMKERETEAELTLRWLHFDGSNDEEVNREFEEIRDSVRADLITSKEVTWMQILSTSSLRRRLFLGSFVWIATIISGLSFIQYYQPFIYKALNFSDSQQLLVTGLYGSVSPIACTCALFFVDHVGRVPLLYITSFGYCACYSIITALSAIYPPVAGVTTNANAQRASVAMVFMVSALHSALAGPVSWTYPPEIYTTQIRAKAHGVAQASQYAISTLLTQVSPIALEKIGWKYYIVFCITNFVCGVIFVLFFPETRGKSLEEINRIFGDDSRDIIGQVHPPRPTSIGSYREDEAKKGDDELSVGSKSTDTFP